MLFSALCFGAAVWRQLSLGPPPPRPDTPRIHPAILTTVNGFLILVSLMAWAGILFGPAAGQ